MRDDLKIARQKAGLTQVQLADKVATTQDAISRFEAGKRPVGLDMAPKLATALGMTIIDVLYGTPKTHKRKVA